MRRKMFFCGAIPGIVLQEQLDKLQSGLEAEHYNEAEQEPAGGVIPDNAGSDIDEMMTTLISLLLRMQRKRRWWQQHWLVCCKGRGFFAAPYLVPSCKSKLNKIQSGLEAKDDNEEEQEPASGVIPRRQQQWDDDNTD